MRLGVNVSEEKSKSDDFRLVMAFFLAPLAVPISLLMLLVLIRANASEIAVIVVLGVLTSYTGTIIVGAPAYAVLKARGVTGIWAAVVVGFGIGAMMWAIFSLLLPLSLGQGLSGVHFSLTDWPMMSGVLWPGGVEGALVGGVFWLIARPDRRTN